MLYIYLKNAAYLSQGGKVKLGDIAQLYQSDGNGTKKEQGLVLGKLDGDRLLVTCVDIAAALGDQHADAQIKGADACVVKPLTVQNKPYQVVIKTIVVSLVIFAGAGMSIMNFHSDVDMPSVHQSLSEVFTGDSEFSPWISLAYCLGIGVGVLFFANMLPGKKKSPSIFEVEQFELEQQTQAFEKSQAESQR